MRLKSFHGRSMAEVMRQVRDALGEDAIIVSTREEGGTVHLTAAVEQLAEETKSPFEIKDQGKIKAITQNEDEILEELTALFLKHRTPSSVTDKIVTSASSFGAENTRKALINALSSVFKFEPIAEKRLKKPLVLVGPPGAGKTLTTAKLAARAVMNNIKVEVISTDTVRAGAAEQLQAFLRLMQLNLKICENADAVQKALGKIPLDQTQVIIDTGGLNPFDAHEMKDLARILSVEAMEPILVLPAGVDAEESAEMAMTFAVLGVKKLLPTRLDFARRFGGLFAAAERTGMSFCDASHTPNVAEGLIHLSSERLTDFLMPPAASAKTKGS
jgi:flagellar biosynthesis protein FlhF